MIDLHGVTKVLGKGDQRTVVLDAIDWLIKPRERYLILGQPGSGKSTLLAILSGAEVPTQGWVERRGVVSPTIGLTRLASGLMTIRQLANDLAMIYRVDPGELGVFVERFASLEGFMDTPVRMLALALRRKLQVALFYGLPCDYYLLDDRLMGRADLKEKVSEAFRLRRQQAGVIFATSSPRAAREFGEGAACILFRGKLWRFDSVDEAIRVFERLPVEQVAAERLRMVKPAAPGIADESDP